MSRVRSRDTKPEMRLRRALWSRGMRYRVCRGDLPGKPDIAFVGDQVAVFVDGEFWHGGQWLRRGLDSLEAQFENSTSDQKDYWIRKIRSNMARDAANTHELLSRGWRVVRFWAGDILRNLEGCVETTIEAVEEGIEATGLRKRVAGRTAADFFAGIGLMQIGLEREGWSVVFSNDIDPDKKAMYTDHFSEEHARNYHVGDVHDLSPDDVPDVTLATASFPCTDLSLAGSRDGLAGRESSAFWGFVEVVDRMGSRRPPFILLENVPGFLTSNEGRDFEAALEALNGLGYAVDAFMLDAVDFVPQSRLRMFVVGIPSDIADFGDVHESFWSVESSVRPKALADFISTHSSINWRVRRLPEPATRKVELADIIEDLPEDSREWWSDERASYLLNQMNSRHRERADAMIAGDDWSYGTVFRRTRNGRSRAELRTDGIAGCLRTPKGGSARQILFVAGKGRYRVRLVTPREAARLMGADEFTIDVPLNQALFGFGDAVCVPVVSWIARHYLNPLINEMLRENVT